MEAGRTHSPAANLIRPAFRVGEAVHLRKRQQRADVLVDIAGRAQAAVRLRARRIWVRHGAIVARGANDGVFGDREEQRELHGAVCAFKPLVHVGADLVVGLGEGDLEYHPREHAHAAIAHGEVRVGLFHEPRHFAPDRRREVAEGKADVGRVAEFD